MPDRRMTRKLDEGLGVENVAHEPHVLVDTGLSVGDGTDARGLLTPMLERIERQERQLRGAFDPR